MTMWLWTVPGLTVAACVAGSTGQFDDARRYTVPIPLGLDLAAPAPDDNALNLAKVDLGRRLFFDPIISRDSSMSCASCHVPRQYFTNGATHALGIRGREGRRNVPSILNVAYGRSFFWDGRVPTLEQQVVQPIQSPTELDLPLAVLEARLKDHPVYRDAFAAAFDADEPTATNAARALASYLRTLRSGNAPIDRYLGGDTSALTASQKRGFRLFTRNCSVCHMAPLFTDHQFHNTGVSWGSDDLGRYRVSGRDEDRGAFKVPSLRNVAHTAPYMHDGSLATLEDVIDHYDRGGTPNPYRDPEIGPLHTTATEKHDLIAFLHALTGEPSTFRKSDGSR